MSPTSSLPFAPFSQRPRFRPLAWRIRTGRGCGTRHEALRVGVRVPLNGRTVEVQAGTSDQGALVLFDDLTVEHTTGMIVQEQHQHGYGAPLVGLNYTVGLTNYRHGYQGQFAEQDPETSWAHFELRDYNSRIGRWHSYDPEGVHHSPYLAMANNPLSVVDPDGGKPGGTLLQRAAAKVGLGSVSSNGFRWSASVTSAVNSAGKAAAPVAKAALRSLVSARDASIGWAHDGRGEAGARVLADIVASPAYLYAYATTGKNMWGEGMGAGGVAVELAGLVPGEKLLLWGLNRLWGLFPF